MEVYRHEGDLHHPTVNFNQSTGILALTGRSLPANPKEFYDPIIGWINDYLQNPHSKTTLHFELEYFNTGTSKQIWDMMKSLKNLKETGKTELVVEWCFEEDDEDMEEAAEEFEELMGMKFVKVPT